jgi:hypothetical protein
MRRVARLGRCLDAGGLGVAGLTGVQVERYMAARRAEGRTSGLSPRSLAAIGNQGLIEFQRPGRAGCAPAASPSHPSTGRTPRPGIRKCPAHG